MSSQFDRGHKVGASKAKANATKQLRKALNIKKSKIKGTTPSGRFESVLGLATQKFAKLKRKARGAGEP
jgi:hypothetical protein